MHKEELKREDSVEKRSFVLGFGAYPPKYVNTEERIHRERKMEIKDRKIRVGENRLYLGEDNILYITNIGEIDEETAIAIRDAVLKLMNMVKGKVHTLTDLNKAGKASPEARKIFNELAEHEKQGKNAFFGMHPVARVITSFFIGVSKKKDMRFFKTKEEALAWLKEAQ